MSKKLEIKFSDWEAVEEAVEFLVEKELDELGLDNIETELISDYRKEKYIDQLSKWFSYSEQVTLVADLEEMTITAKELR